MTGSMAEKFDDSFEKFEILLSEQIQEEFEKLKADILVSMQKLATTEPIIPTAPPKEFQAIAKLQFSHFCMKCGFEYEHEKIIKILQNRDVNLRHVICPKCKYPITFQVQELLS